MKTTKTSRVSKAISNFKLSSKRTLNHTSQKGDTLWLQIKLNFILRAKRLRKPDALKRSRLSLRNTLLTRPTSRDCSQSWRNKSQVKIFMVQSPSGNLLFAFTWLLTTLKWMLLEPKTWKLVANSQLTWLSFFSCKFSLWLLKDTSVELTLELLWERLELELMPT